MDNDKMPNVNETLKQRGSVHGDFTENATMSQDLWHTAARGSSFDRMSKIQKEALKVILAKVARIVCGNPDHHDHWHDIAGYAKLTEDRIPHPARPVTFRDTLEYQEAIRQLDIQFGATLETFKVDAMTDKDNPSLPLEGELHYNPVEGY